VRRRSVGRSAVGLTTKAKNTDLHRGLT
jgi:hypothetical protein